MPKRSGRKSASQTPAPKSDIVYGSKSNPKGSASSENSAKNIKLSEKTEKVLKNKLSEFKEEHPNKKSVTLSDLKAVYRRGSGAYSKSHRPTITGGAPNSRAAWSYARVNKFLKKAGGAKVKAAYVQDDDLFAKGGQLGDCYKAAGDFCMLAPVEFIGEPYLVHAEVKGQGKAEGIRFGHAWVEDDENVYDYSNGREIVMTKVIYYAIGDIQTNNPKKYQKYTIPEARAKMLKTKNYGSWDIETEYADGGLVAPNGKPSNLTPEQYKLVRTPQFKAWFGDWEYLANLDSLYLEISDTKDYVNGILKDDNFPPKIKPNSILHYKKGFDYILSSDENGKIIGALTIYPNGKIDQLAISEKMRGMGIGKKMIDLAIENGAKSVATYTKYSKSLIKYFLDKTVSKVVDENGEPMVVYHGSRIDFTIFDKEKVSKDNKWGSGFYFTEDYEYAKGYANSRFSEVKNKEPISVFLKLDDIYDIHKNKNHTEYVVYESNRIKLADGTNKTFDIDNQDIRYEKGGKTYNDKELLSKWKKRESIGFTGEAHLKAKGLIPRADGTKRKSEKYMANGGQASQEINCVNCGWKWETADSDKEDMYLCHQCGFDNTLYYSDIMSKLKKPMSVSEISQKHGVNTQYIENQLDIGIKHELEHTDDEGVAKIIALHHIGEKPNYYELVEKYKLEDGGQPSKFWHQADQYEIADFIQNERMATEELLCSGDTRIAKAIICRAKIDIAEQKEQKSNNLEEKNAWSAVKNIWEECLNDIKNGVVYEYKDGGECGCMSYKDGGLAYGNSHDKGGMPLKVESTGQNIEIEGGEGVINKRSMQMSKKLDFQGKKMTPCQIVSKINEMGGGVKFKCQDVAEILAKDGNF